MLHNDVVTLTNAQLAILALRLIKSGDMRMGALFSARPSRFDVGRRGMSFQGFSLWQPSLQYQLNSNEVPTARRTHMILLDFYDEHAAAWQNVALALRRFSLNYERYFGQHEDRVVDAMIAIEALLSRDPSELAFKLAFRTAGILAANDVERVSLFQQMRGYYVTRSKIVHGSELDAQQRQIVQDPEPLLDIVRKLLVAFLHLARSREYGARQFYRGLDNLLQSTKGRIKLRRCMRLT